MVYEKSSNCRKRERNLLHQTEALVIHWFGIMCCCYFLDEFIYYFRNPVIDHSLMPCEKLNHQPNSCLKQHQNRMSNKQAFQVWSISEVRHVINKTGDSIRQQKMITDQNKGCKQGRKCKLVAKFYVFLHGGVVLSIVTAITNNP